MKKIFLSVICVLLAGMVMAQQWAGGSTTSDTIYRFGITRIIPDTVCEPYVELTSEAFTAYRYYAQDPSGGNFRWNFTRINYDGIRMGRNIPAPSNSTIIGLGTFSFYTGDPYEGSLHLIYNNQGVLSSTGKITTTDSVIAANINVINSISATYGNFSTLRPNFIAVNGATTSSTYKLAVNSGILCEELKVMADVPSSDYVFEKNYKLRPLHEVEMFVNENKHLPDVPSAKEFKKDGYKVGEMDDLLLRKIEELTLYIIDLQKQIEELKK